MRAPNVPNEKLIGDDGGIHPTWRNYFSQLSGQIQKYSNKQGTYLPHNSQDNVDSLSNDESKGGMLYNSDTESAFVNAGGTYKHMSTLESLGSDEIAAIPANQRNGRFFHNTDTGELMSGFNDTIKTVTTT